MAELIVITPSRGRPARLAELVTAVAETTGGRAEVLGLIDDDDPARADYEALIGEPGYVAYAPLRTIFGPRQSLAGWTNLAACNAVRATIGERPRYLASLGDDHLPRTYGWDRLLIKAIEEMDGPGFAYGNDLLQGRALPTAWVVSAQVVAALGWMMLPGCEHRYVDNAVRELGLKADRLAYVPGVVIEHLHPIAGKADWDSSYEESNSGDRDAADKAAFLKWQRDGLDHDAAVVRALKWGGDA